MGDPYQPPNVPQPYDPMGGYTAPPTNNVGLTGFILALCGTLCAPLFPVGLIVSLVGLRRQPKAFAIAGTVVGAVGTLLLFLLVAIYGAMIAACIGFGAFVQPQFETQMTITQANGVLQEYYEDNGAEPDQATADSLIGGNLDAWGNPLRYEPQGEGDFVLRSAGADGVYDTADDITKRFTYGTPDYGWEEDFEGDSSAGPSDGGYDSQAEQAGVSEAMEEGETQSEPAPAAASDETQDF